MVDIKRYDETLFSEWEAFNVPIHRKVEECVARNPSRIAVRTPTETFSYEHLNHLANCVANDLINEGFKNKKARIALVFFNTRNMPMILISHLAVWKTGNICVGLNLSDGLVAGVSDPKTKYAVTYDKLRAAGVELILTDSECIKLVLEIWDDAQTVWNIEKVKITPVPQFFPKHNPDIEVQSTDLAYIGYTTGSTGQQKGVMHTHRNHMILSRSMGRYFGYVPGDVITAFRYNEAGYNEMLSALTNGMEIASCDVFPMETESDPSEWLAQWINDAGVTILKTVASIFALLSAGPRIQMPNVRIIDIGGESVLLAHVSAFIDLFPNAVLNIRWSTSESNTGCFYSITRDADLSDLRVEDSDNMPVGYPLEHNRIYILAENGSEVPDGELGEIVIESPALALGYLNQPELTAKQFLDLGGDPPIRRFRSRDRGRKRAKDGRLEILGKLDVIIDKRPKAQKNRPAV